MPSSSTPRLRIESASLPLASRRLGRSDETWLTQVCVRLRLVETHLALVSALEVVQVDHLQMSVKLGPTEIDAMYLVIEETGAAGAAGAAGTGATREVLLTCEAKGRSDDILEGQVVSQVRSAFGLSDTGQDRVVPVAVKAVGPSEVFVVEFEAVGRAEADDLEDLQVASSAVYELVPPVPGIGE